MSYLLTLHHDAELTLSSTEPLVPAQQLTSLQDASALVARLSELLAVREKRVKEAERKARERGKKAGHAAGEAAARQEGAVSLANALADLAQTQLAQREELRQALVALASGMVRSMTAELAPATVLTALAKRAFEHVVPPQPVRLRLPPDMVEPVRAQLAEHEAAVSVQCVGDPDLHGLQCVLECATGVLLAGLDDVLERTVQSLETRRRASAGERAQEPLL
ncbi:MAG: flagellar assembly protein FliH [Burkholderiaceae bacterium]|jgi:flagellar assembly protein FliH|nr:flagellar assembly protein FliH [Burkholderiaceae bacterium]